VPTLIDISPVVSPRIAVFPGDVAYERRVALDIARGDHLTLSSMLGTVHLGAHADAPSHYVKGGSPIAERPLELYYGPAQVMRVPVPRGRRIYRRDVTTPVRAPRVLFCTGTQPDPDVFNTDFAALSPELVEALAVEGVRLVGIDTPSIDLSDSKALEAHQAVARHDMAVLEGLVLNDAPDGLYTLIALPLKLEGADGAPVRAALVRD
jgi:arylformamidase